MNAPPPFPISWPQIESLRQQHYNARVESMARVGDDVVILRVVPDTPFPPFEPGQYATLGLGYWEPRAGGPPAEPLSPADWRRLAKRPYSITCSLMDDQGRLLRADGQSYLEFLITLVRHAERAPVLTPRLFALAPGSRLYVAPAPHGRYTLRRITGAETVLFAATGAGEAPHNAMLAELLHRGHRGRLASLVCVRYRRDLAYAAAHRRLEQRYANYRFLGLTTREPENLDPSDTHYVGKQYIQDFVAAGDLESELGFRLAPENTHVYLCGSPAMIGAPLRTDAADRDAQPTGMVEVLQRRGFRLDAPGEPGNVHFEKYWRN